ncbi:putative tetratricopeptide-like helical domain superfamily [Helianthus annuus]|uniref:Tetratricopeptide-like helical domain superfamily n=1 Tax=Helianthus annuus TaxID=4232 RepID=A0A9K3JRU9_HELAN|nr:putative tetratricopeptide-like helical domain superfamily [Helianthus annuus]KAJ0620176.1 putative tetratricopeptide-like helical domain superfamily [Helianthus annuus]KAJ0778628.1 putative tetratricopeptide-like helical domain superfamily [Helianthus annuus]
MPEMGMGVSPDVTRYNILLDGFGRNLQFYKCFQLLEEMETNGLIPNAISSGSLVNHLCKDGRLLEAQVIFIDMTSRGVLPNTRIYNMLINGYCNQGNIQDAYKMVDKMSSDNVVPTFYTYNTLINGLCKKGKQRKVFRVIREDESIRNKTYYQHVSSANYRMQKKRV